MHRKERHGDEEYRQNGMDQQPSTSSSRAPSEMPSNQKIPPWPRDRNREAEERKLAELYRMDFITAMKIPDSEFFESENAFQVVDSWRQDWLRPIQVPVNVGSIPRPVYREVQERSKKSTSSGYKLPKKYVRVVKTGDYNPGKHHFSPNNRAQEKVCRYDMDDLDFCWLMMVNKDREKMGRIWF